MTRLSCSNRLADTTGCIINDAARYFKHQISQLNVVAHWTLSERHEKNPFIQKCKQAHIILKNCLSCWLTICQVEPIWFIHSTGKKQVSNNVVLIDGFPKKIYLCDFFARIQMLCKVNITCIILKFDLIMRTLKSGLN